MALSKLSGDEQGILFVQLCNVLDPGIAVALASVSNELRTATRVPLQQLKTGHKAAAALCRKLGFRNCKALREAKKIDAPCYNGLTADELKLLGTLGSVLPALEELTLMEPAAGNDGVRQLADGLGAGALPAVTHLRIFATHVGDAGASALAAALGKGALPRLKTLRLYNAAIGDAALVALAPALRRRPALEGLNFFGSPIGDEGLAALVAPPPRAGAPPPTTGGLAKLKELVLTNTQITDAGYATLTAALDSGALPALEELGLNSGPAYGAKAALYEALAYLKTRREETRLYRSMRTLLGREDSVWNHVKSLKFLDTDLPGHEFATDDSTPWHAMALRELLTSAPASWNCRTVAFQIKTLFATTEADDDPRVRLDEPDDDMTGAPVLFHVVEHMGVSGGRLARMSKEEKVDLLKILAEHGASWHQENAFEAALPDEKHSALEEARLYFPKLYSFLKLDELAGPPPSV